MPEPEARAAPAAKPCRHCHDEIHPRASICKSCGLPQSALGRIARLASSALSWLVALGSLGIAYAEYRNAQTAQARERITHMALSAETRAAEQALGDVVRAAASAGAGADKLERGLSRRPAREVASLEHEVRANPTDVQARRDLLVRRALGQ